MPAYHSSPEAQLINKYFIRKLLELTPDDLSIQRRLEIVFCAQQRRVVLAYISEDIFSMPGLVMREGDADLMRDPINNEHRLFKKGTAVFVRIDALQPNRIDIQHAKTEPDLTFVLNSSEYRVIMEKLNEVGGCQDLLDPSTLRVDL